MLMNHQNPVFERAKKTCISLRFLETGTKEQVAGHFPPNLGKPQGKFFF